MKTVPEFDRTILKDKIGRFRTASLFMELNQDSDPAIFTLKENDHSLHGIDYLSLKRIYLEFGDVTEYEFAIAVFGSWRHWQKLCNNKIIREHIDEWREELEIKIRARAIQSIITTAITEGSKGTTAAKWIAEASWKGSGRGRPSKEEVERTKRIHAGIDKDISDDLERIGVSH